MTARKNTLPARLPARAARRGRSTACAAWLAITCVSLSVEASLRSIGEGTFSFRATGPAGLGVDGEATGAVATENAGFITMQAPLTELATGLRVCDEQLKDALEVERYPSTQFRVARSKLLLPADKSSLESSAIGELTLHGVTKPIEFFYEASRTGSDYHVRARFTVLLGQFGIEAPCFLRACVDDDVEVIALFKLREG